MTSASQELERLQMLQAQAREHLAAGRLDEAEQALVEAQALEENNVRTLTLQAELAEALGDTAGAEALRARAAAERKAAWQRDVEAEIRGKHEMMGEPTRHKTH